MHSELLPMACGQLMTARGTAEAEPRVIAVPGGSRREPGTEEKSPLPHAREVTSRNALFVALPRQSLGPRGKI